MSMKKHSQLVVGYGDSHALDVALDRLKKRLGFDLGVIQIKSALTSVDEQMFEHRYKIEFECYTGSGHEATYYDAVAFVILHHFRANVWSSRWETKAVRMRITRSHSY